MRAVSASGRINRICLVFGRLLRNVVRVFYRLFPLLSSPHMAFRPAVRVASKALPTPLALRAMSVPRFPPHLAGTDHRQRCMEQLRSKSVSLDKYIYLNGLKGRDSNLFYDILLGNMLVRTHTLSLQTPY